MFCIASDETCSLPSQGMSPHRAKLTGYIITLNKVKGLARALPAFSPRLKVFFSVSRIFLPTIFFFKWKKKLIFKWKRKSSGHRNGIIDPLFRQETFHHQNCILDTKNLNRQTSWKARYKKNEFSNRITVTRLTITYQNVKTWQKTFVLRTAVLITTFYSKSKSWTRNFSFHKFHDFFFSSKSKPRTRKLSFCLATPGTKCLAPALLNIIHQYYT